jgi:hypothetical protein
MERLSLVAAAQERSGAINRAAWPGKNPRRSLGRVKRPRYPVPSDIEAALVERGLITAYGERPSYQQNDYVGWIGRSKRPDTRQKRLAQMLDELEEGRLYMGMPHNPTGRPP